MQTTPKHAYYEFFAGGGMARAGLGAGWDCLLANDFDEMKARTYAENYGSDDLLLEDVGKVTVNDLPGSADLAWASFPCQDLSLAGDYQGLGHRSSAVVTRSGTFWPFWNLMRGLLAEGRAPTLIVLENVIGVLTSRQGKDFTAICSAFSGAGYRFGAVVIDARHFVPQSRQRVFFVAVAPGHVVPKSLSETGPSESWHPAALCKAQDAISTEAKRKWIWWNVAHPARRNMAFCDLIEEEPTGCRWHTKEETKRLLSLMGTLHRSKVNEAKKAGRRMVGGVYRRTRQDEQGVKRQRAEVRFDDLAGCLRTPRGGSSRQTIIVVDGDEIRSRLLSPREAARLMGLPEDYRLPPRYNDAYQVAGDGVCVPVVRHIAANLLEPILAAGLKEELLAAE